MPNQGSKFSSAKSFDRWHLTCSIIILRLGLDSSGTFFGGFEIKWHTVIVAKALASCTSI